MIEKIKTCLGITDNEKDNLLELLAEFAAAAFEDTTGRAAADYQTIIIRMVVEDYNRLGSEGVSSLSFGSLTENCLDDYSPQLQKHIRRCKVIKVG